MNFIRLMNTQKIPCILWLYKRNIAHFNLESHAYSVIIKLIFEQINGIILFLMKTNDFLKDHTILLAIPRPLTANSSG